MDNTEKKVEYNEGKKIKLSHLITNPTNSDYQTEAYKLESDAGHSITNPKVIEALGNHAVLTEIIKHGSFRDLKNFRLINKQWKGIANSAIIQRRLWKLKISHRFSAYIYDGNSNEALPKLNDCIEASGGSFPLTTLDFSDVDDYNFFNSPALLKFYTLMGPSIRHVKLHNCGPLTVTEFQDLLLNKMPNVNHIDAGIIFFTNHQDEEFPVPIVLPYLKTIRFINNYGPKPFRVPPYYKYLLLAATNLKEILHFRLQLTNILIDTGKINCITSLQCDSQLRTRFGLYVKLSHSEPKLTSLTITRHFYQLNNGEDSNLSAELTQSLKRILISSKDTLKHLHLASPVLSLISQFPKLANLESFTVMDNDDDLYMREVSLSRVIPAGYNCSENFPNLHTVIFHDIGLDDIGNLDKHFPSLAFPSVKKVVFHDRFHFGSSLMTIFPNLAHIKIIDFKSMTSLTEEDVLFNNKITHAQIDNRIESLEFYQCLLARSRPGCELDSLFTGVPVPVCRKLLEKHNNRKARGDDDNILAVKEILDLIQSQNYMFRNSNGLRRLKIIFNHKDNAFFQASKNSKSDLDSEDWGDMDGGFKTSTPVISPVSCVYGFSLMPNLEQVIIGYDHYMFNASDIAQVFKPFAEFPYIKIIHEPTLRSTKKKR